MSRSFAGPALIVLLASTLRANELPAAIPDDGAESRPAPPKLALVLSGGGARGAAHIGVLRVLEEMHVRPDLIVGTSMGSIVGGLYAAGWSPDEIEDLLTTINWNEVFFDKVARDDKSFRRKKDDDPYLIQARLRFKGWKPYFPKGVIGGQRLELLLKSLEFRSTSARRFDDLPIPFRAVAADAVTGETVVLDRGSLATAMRASMSIWGAFAPVEIGGRMLVDGGAVANLPVGVAQDLGAERIVAVDISSPLYSKEELKSFLSVISQVNSFLTVGNRAADAKRLRPGDVLIVPDLGDLTFSDFQRATEAVGIGEAAARRMEGELRALAASDAAWAEFRARHHRRDPAELRVDEVRLVNTSPVADEVVRRRIDIPTGGALDAEAIRRTVVKLSGLDYFGLIGDDFEIEPDGRGVLTLRTPSKPYGRNSLQFGLSLQDDFKGDATYTFTARHLLIAANRWGGEWQNVVQVGSTGVAATEFYQPLDRGMRWFVSPGGEVRGRTQALWSDGRPVADYRVASREVRIDLGRVFENWGELRIGEYYGYANGSVRVGPPQLPEFGEHDGGIRVLFSVDTLDSTIFARHGTTVSMRYSRALTSVGSDVTYSQFRIAAGKPLSFGKNTVYPAFELSTNLREPTTLEAEYTLGGFLRLSGLGVNELIDERGGLARILYYRQLSRLDLGALSSRLYLGLSVEAGNVYAKGDRVTWESLRKGGSLFLGAETVIGPAYLAWGYTDGGRTRTYLTIGQSF